MRIPPYPVKGGSVESTIREIIAYIRATTITSVSGGRLKVFPNGTTLQIGVNESGSSIPQTCPFGEIIDVDDGTYTKAIRGGAMLCGDKNFNVPYLGIALGTDSWSLIQITLTGIDPASDDDDEIFLPGCITASGTPSWGTVTYTGSESHTSNTNPATPAGTGTIVIPIGVLKVVSGTATFTPTGCGTIRVSQCAGILDHSRG